MLVMREGGLTSLKIRQGNLSISLDARTAGSSQSSAMSGGSAPVLDSAPLPPQAAAETPGFTITAPMIGTFYAAPGPGERPFVEVGQEVAAGETVAIIEAMKIMNEIVAEQAGVVAEIFVSNGETVEFGHPLMRLRQGS
jgi:acetyl-CoA carboxylase biotin carboxyl carrier protein